MGNVGWYKEVWNFRALGCVGDGGTGGVCVDLGFAFSVLGCRWILVTKVSEFPEFPIWRYDSGWSCDCLLLCLGLHVDLSGRLPGLWTF